MENLESLEKLGNTANVGRLVACSLQYGVAQTRQPSGSFRIQRIGLGAIGPNRVDRLLAVLQRHFTLVFICFSQSISMKSSL